MQRSEPGTAASWDDYRVLLAVAETGSFALAGRKLEVATSTASRRIAAWERRLGVRIVVRRSSGVLLTEVGAQLVEVARALEERVATVERAVARGDESEQGTVRVTAGDGMEDALVPILAELRARHPTIDVELIIDPRTIDLSKGHADVAIRAVRPAGAGLLARKIGFFRLGLYAASHYVERKGIPRRLRDLARHDVIGLTAPLAQNPAQRWLHELGIEHAAFRANSVALAQRAVHAGLGIGAIGHALGAGLHRVLPNLETGPHPVWLVRHRDTRGRRAVELVCDFLDERLRPLGA